MNDAALLVDDPRLEVMYDIESEAELVGTGIFEDPYAAWALLQQQGPVHEGTVPECMGLPPERSGNLYKPGFTYFSAFSFAAASDVFTRKDDFSSEFSLEIGIQRMFGDSILTMDGLRHRRYRDVIQSSFQPAMASSWWREKVIQPLVDQLADRLAGQQSVDLSAQFFARLPLHAMTAGFGMSPAEGIEFRYQIHRAVQHGQTAAQMMEAMDAAGRVLDHVIRERQAEPRDDIISALAHAKLDEDDGSTRALTVEEIITFCRLIVFAGGGTTWRQLGITMVALLDNPDQLENLAADRSLMDSAILESARWNATDPVFARMAIRDTTLQGVAIPKGAVVHNCLGAGNRDPARWENPHQYDLSRPVQRSLAFAAGHHSCLGQHVARQEMSVALNALLDRFPNIRRDPSHPPARISGGLLQRGATALHVLLQ